MKKSDGPGGYVPPHMRGGGAGGGGGGYGMDRDDGPSLRVTNLSDDATQTDLQAPRAQCCAQYPVLPLHWLCSCKAQCQLRSCARCQAVLPTSTVPVSTGSLELLLHRHFAHLILHRLCTIRCRSSSGHSAALPGFPSHATAPLEWCLPIPPFFVVVVAHLHTHRAS